MRDQEAHVFHVGDGRRSRGARKSYEMVRYFEGDDIFCVHAQSLRTPRLKKKERGEGVTLIKEISWREYISGKRQERRDSYFDRN